MLCRAPGGCLRGLGRTPMPVTRYGNRNRWRRRGRPGLWAYRRGTATAIVLLRHELWRRPMVTMTDAAGDFLSYIVTSDLVATADGQWCVRRNIARSDARGLHEARESHRGPECRPDSGRRLRERATHAQLRECTDYRLRRDGQSRDAVSGGCQGKRVDRHSDRYRAAR